MKRAKKNTTYAKRMNDFGYVTLKSTTSVGKHVKVVVKK
jgi:hypothetical protein